MILCGITHILWIAAKSSHQCQTKGQMTMKSQITRETQQKRSKMSYGSLCMFNERGTNVKTLGYAYFHHAWCVNLSPPLSYILWFPFGCWLLKKLLECFHVTLVFFWVGRDWKLALANKSSNWWSSGKTNVHIRNFSAFECQFNMTFEENARE
jgi:hypothetical protein